MIQVTPQFGAGCEADYARDCPTFTGTELLSLWPDLALIPSLTFVAVTVPNQRDSVDSGFETFSGWLGPRPEA